MIAFLFPGQGSQTAGMGRALAQAFPAAQAVFDEADRALGFSISQICFEGSDADLRPTEVAQPALLACSIAALRCVEDLGWKADLLAGHSLGEYSALVAAGALSFPDAIRLVRQRGNLMAEASRERPGAMAAVLGLETAKVIEVCRAAQGIVAPANLNAPGQVVISGTVEAVQDASQKSRAAGAARVIPLAVSGAFHSTLMNEAADRMRIILDDAPFREAQIPVVANTTALPAQSPGEIRRALEAQMASGVRWEESVRCLERAGVAYYVEIGPGKALSGLVRKIIPGALTYNVGDPAGVEGLGAFLRPAENRAQIGQ